MTCNVGPRERIIRLASGMAIGTAAAGRQMALWKRLALGAVAVAQIVTATTRYCPVNQLFGIDNCPER